MCIHKNSNQPAHSVFPGHCVYSKDLQLLQADAEADQSSLYVHIKRYIFICLG